jgi:menaquinone-dependent protoporphyrinogen oxidase
MNNTIIDRRGFLRKSCTYSLTALMAQNFGCSIKELIGDGDAIVSLIYGTKYGATRDTVHWIKKGIGNHVELLDVENLNFKDALRDYEYFIVGSGVWIDGVHKRLKDFLSSESAQLKGKVAGAFVVCGSQDTAEGGRRRIQKYLDQVHALLGYTPELSEHFGGRVIVEKLTREDRDALENFYRKYLKKELQSWDRTDMDKALAYGSELKELLGKYSVRA